MGELVHIARTQLFSFEQARRLVPVVLNITAFTASRVDQLLQKRERALLLGFPDTQRLEDQIDAEIELWEAKIEKLGGKPAGFWVVDFDFGGGYFCWKYPEPDLLFWHGYEEGMSGRNSIELK